MRTKKMRLLSFVLALAMMLAIAPVGAFAENGKKPTPTDGHYEIVVTENSDTEDAISDKSTKSGVQKALEAAYEFSSTGDDRFDNVKTLTITTAEGVVLNKADIQFLSGVKVESVTSYNYAGGSENSSNGVVSVVDTSYYWLRELTEVDLTNAALKDNKFPDRAFCSNIKVQTIFFPDTLVSTGYKTFGFMDALSYIGTKKGKASNTMTFPETLTTIDNAAFYHDPSLKCRVELPESVTYLGSAAFERTPVTGDIVIRRNVTMESNGAFLFRETNIDSIKIENGVKVIGQLAFSCKSSGPVRKLSETLVIPESVESIGKEAFNYVGTDVKTIIVGNEDVTLGEKAFAGLSAKIYFKRAVANSIDGDKNKKIWNGTATIFNTNGGTIETNSNGDIVAQMDDTLGVYIPVKDGYKFLGWYNGKTQLESAALTGKTYTAKWAELHTVTFADADIDSVQVADGENLAEPKAPKKDGYKFDGWYNGETKVDFPLTITADTTLTAKWHKYNLTTTVEKTNVDQKNEIGKPVEIAVAVTGAAEDFINITKLSLNFDKPEAVKEVKLTMNSFNDEEVDETADLTKHADDNYQHMNLSEEEPSEIALQEALPETITAKMTLSVVYSAGGKNNVEIVFENKDDNVVCAKTAEVEVAYAPETLNLTACTAKLSDGTEVKNGDKVPVGAEVTVSFNKDFYADSNLVLSGWQVKPKDLTDVNGKLVKDITADSFTFVMPETENGVTIEAQTKTADTEDDSWDAATVVTGVAIGAGAAVLTYHIGTELYAKQVLGDGVAVPKTREEVALKAWELAGKPAVAVEGEPLSEAAQAEKWAVESGLMQNDAEDSFNGAKKMNKLKALRVLDSAKKMGAQ